MFRHAAGLLCWLCLPYPSAISVLLEGDFWAIFKPQIKTASTFFKKRKGTKKSGRTREFIACADRSESLAAYHNHAIVLNGDLGF